MPDRTLPVPPRPRARRWSAGPVIRGAALVAGTAVALGAGIMAAALIATPGPWTQGYVSEVGAAGRPFAAAYRAGVLTVAVGVTLLGVALFPATRTAAALLVAAGAFAAATAAVPCSDGCPLPPYQVATAADLAHTAAGIAGMAACGFAMVAVAGAAAAGRARRRLAAAAAWITFPLAAVEAAAMAALGRGWVTGSVERLLLVVAVCWLLGHAVCTVRRPLAESPPPDHGSTRSRTFVVLLPWRRDLPAVGYGRPALRWAGLLLTIMVSVGIAVATKW